MKKLSAVLFLILIILFSTAAAESARARDLPDPALVKHLKIYGGAPETDPEQQEYTPSEYDVPITKQTFPNKVFRTYVKAHFDLDGTGIYSGTFTKQFTILEATE